MMVVSRDRQNIGKRGRTVSLEWKGAPSVPLMGTLLFFLLLALGFPGGTLSSSGVERRPVAGEVRKASVPSPLVSEEGGSSAPVQPILPFLNYAVEEGDSLSLIASRFSLEADTLISLNQLSDPREIYPGRRLYIPSRDGARKSLPDEMTEEELAHLFSLTREDLIPLGSRDYFLAGIKPDRESMDRFWGDFFAYPLNGVILGEYGKSTDNLTGLPLVREGIDLQAYTGQPVFAIGDGVITKEGFHGTYGWYMIVNHKGGYQSLYAHLQSFEAEEGGTVRRGDTIARAGNSGHTAGNLLFFSLFKEGKTVNPKDYLF